jgi:hypothetical protein
MAGRGGIVKFKEDFGAQSGVFGHSKTVIEEPEIAMELKASGAYSSSGVKRIRGIGLGDRNRRGRDEDKRVVVGRCREDGGTWRVGPKGLPACE